MSEMDYIKKTISTILESLEIIRERLENLENKVEAIEYRDKPKGSC